jgi:hypothetical protein
MTDYCECCLASASHAERTYRGAIEPLMYLLMYVFILYIILYYIHKYHSNLIPEGVAELLGYSSETPTFYQNDLDMRKRNTADVTGGKPMAL